MTLKDLKEKIGKINKQEKIRYSILGLLLIGALGYTMYPYIIKDDNSKKEKHKITQQIVKKKDNNKIVNINKENNVEKNKEEEKEENIFYKSIKDFNFKKISLENKYILSKNEKDIERINKLIELGILQKQDNSNLDKKQDNEKNIENLESNKKFKINTTNINNKISYLINTPILILSRFKEESNLIKNQKYVKGTNIIFDENKLKKILKEENIELYQIEGKILDLDNKISIKLILKYKDNISNIKYDVEGVLSIDNKKGEIEIEDINILMKRNFNTIGNINIKTYIISKEGNIEYQIEGKIEKYTFNLKQDENTNNITIQRIEKKGPLKFKKFILINN